MQTRRPRNVRSILAAAAAFAGAASLPAMALAQSASTSDGLAASNPLQRASELRDEGKVFAARETLVELLGASRVSLSDEQRAEAYAMLDTLTTELRGLDPYELSLQKADFALTRDELRMARQHAGAVARAGTADLEQVERANALLSRVEARRAEIAPTMRAKFAESLRAFDAGEYAQAKAGFERVTRSGVDLSADESAALGRCQERIVALEAARGERFSTDIASAGVLQEGQPENDAGVVRRQESNPAEPVDDAAREAEEVVERVEEGVNEAQNEADTAYITPDAWAPTETTSDSGAATGAAETIVQVQPEQPTQPAGDDLIETARRFEAQSTLAEADEAFAQSRWADARAKYQRAISEFRAYLSGDQVTHAEGRIAEATLQMGGNQPGSLLDDVRGNRQLAAEQKKAEYENQVEQARRALAAGDTDGARDLSARAKLTLTSARSQQLFSESDFEARAMELAKLNADIAAESERIAQTERASKEQSLAEQAREDAMRRERERDRRIIEAIDRVRALQQEMKYREALQVVESQILFLDPINPAGLVLRDSLRDTIIYVENAGLTTDRNFAIADQQLDNSEAMIAPRTIVAYPPDWPAISVARAGIDVANETPEDRRVLTKLDREKMPAKFEDVTLADVFTFVAQVSKIDMDVDWESLEEIGIDRETTVSLSLNNGTIRSVLERVLDKVSTDPVTQADWAVSDGMLQIASEDKIRRKTVLETYDIRDLVFEVPDHEEAPEIDLQSVLQSSQGGGGGQSPFQDNQDDEDDRIPLDERIDRIKDIITQNVDQESWPEGGGDTGFIQELNGLLLIRNTPKNHREIRSLLGKLREVRAMQINVETRFLLVAQDFFEQIGFDLDVYFNANNNQVRAARGTDATIQPSDFFDFGQGGLLRDVNGSATTDVDQGVINPRSWSPIGNSQNSLGLAGALMPGEGIAATILGEAPALGVSGQFLDDVQVDFLIQATQADRRSVQLTAPRLTFTNGQVSNIYVVTQQSFVSDLQPIVSDSAVGFDPDLEVVSEGVVMLVEGQVTADRRYVMLNVDTAVSQIEGFAQQAVTAVAGGQLVSSADTQSFIQLPTVTVTRVQTTVTVPDQGTVLLGGQRLVNETEVETGVPVLSKIPIINRFFTNRIEAREEQTLLILIKPTVLIQSEQENNAFPGLSETLGLGG